MEQQDKINKANFNKLSQYIMQIKTEADSRKQKNLKTMTAIEENVQN